MTDNSTFAITHLVGTSTVGVDDAIKNGIKRASETLRNLDWFEVTDIRGAIGPLSEIRQYQVTMKLGFKYDS